MKTHLLVVCVVCLVSTACSSDPEPSSTGDAAHVDVADVADVTPDAQLDTELDTEPDTQQDVDAEGDGPDPDTDVDADPDAATDSADGEVTDASDRDDVTADATPDGPPMLADPALLSPATLYAEFFAEHPEGDLPPIIAAAIRTFVEAEHLLEADDAAGALEILDAFWATYPIGDALWWGVYFGVDPTNVGTPPGYYGLRMMTDMARWRVAGGRVTGDPVRMTVVMPACSRGILPNTQTELEAGTGEMVEHAFEASIRADGYRILGQSLRLFRNYVEAATDGGLTVEVELLELPDVCLTVGASLVGEAAYAYDFDGMNAIWADVPDDVKQRTDWWWVLYPSHVPEDSEEIGELAFITGGMGLGPDGCSPAFIIDDRWLTRIPPHLGDGPYTDLERRMYLPQWLQHEFFHHLYRTWPEYGLEAEGHQWFDRDTWPDDFVGLFEPDYYHESLYRRLADATPSLAAGLRCTPPPSALWEALEIDDVLGTYERRPVENGYHRGTISQDGERLRWTNESGVSWALDPALAEGLLRTGEGNPYAGSPGADAFRLSPERDDDGRYLPSVAGFRFTGELYERLRP